MHLTDCVSMMLRLGAARRPLARRTRRATSASKRSNSPCASHLRNQPYTVRQCGPPGGSARHGPPLRRCQAMPRTTAAYGVARPLRGGSARSSQRATSATACSDTISFRRASCRARCASVHICPLSQTTMVTAGSDRDQPHSPTQTGSKSVLVFCPKGGVGKTTVSRGLAVSAAKEGHRVLVIDFDAEQGTFTKWFHK